MAMTLSNNNTATSPTTASTHSGERSPVPVSPLSGAAASPAAEGAEAGGNSTNPATAKTTNDGNNNEDTNSSSSNTNQSSTTSNNNTTSTSTNSTNASNIKRKPSRRANTAERRATHNAVERQRRETLNGRFLDLAALLPNLSQIRRPSKSSIVNSSIAHIHASRRHRMLASRELRLLKAESDALRRELNEWRDRAGLPRVEEPIRSDAYNLVVSGEMDAMMITAEMGAHPPGVHHGVNGSVGVMGGVEEELEDGDDEWGMGGGGYEDEMVVAQVPSQQQQQQQSQYAQFGPVATPQGYGMPPHPHQQHHHPGAYHGHPMQGYLDDEVNPRAKAANGGNPFAHNLPPRNNSIGGGSPVVGYGDGGAGALFTPPATRDGPIMQQQASSNGSASPAHSVHSVHSAHSMGPQGASPSPSLGHGGSPPPLSAVSAMSGYHQQRSGSGSPVGFAAQQQQGGGANYELTSSGPGGYGTYHPGPPPPVTSATQQHHAHPHPHPHHGAHHGMHQGYHPQQQQQTAMLGSYGHLGGMVNGMNGAMGGMGGQHGPQMVGAGAVGGVFGMMI